MQSSSATTTIVITMAGQGLIILEAGTALAFGANIGTCITAQLAALGKPLEAKRAATVKKLIPTKVDEEKEIKRSKYLDEALI